MRKQYLSAPLPFVGQKRMFAREFIKVLKQYPEDTVFVDLFGGSGLLSHIAKCQKPNATVIYNDFDGYRNRLQHIPQTNRLLADLRKMVEAEGVPKHSCIRGDLRDRIFARLEQEEREVGYIDFITITSGLMFSMKYKLSIAEMRKEALYNNLRKTDFPLCDDYEQLLPIPRYATPISPLLVNHISGIPSMRQIYSYPIRIIPIHTGKTFIILCFILP